MTETTTPTTPDRGALALRLLHLILIALMIGVAAAVLHTLSVVQFVIMLVDKGRKNAQIAAFGASLGAWLAKATRHQLAESDEKPWPWSPLG